MRVEAGFYVVHRLPSQARVRHRCALIVTIEVVVELSRGSHVLWNLSNVDLELFILVLRIFRLVIHLMEVSDQVVISSRE